MSLCLRGKWGSTTLYSLSFTFTDFAWSGFLGFVESYVFIFGIAIISLDLAFMIVGLTIFIVYSMRITKLDKQFYWW
jgi:hypothetical protein